MATTVFISYAHADEQYRESLVQHLRILERTGLISGWHDRKIGPGMEWETEIDRELTQAAVILLLVSPAFVASEYCWSKEMTEALRQHERGEAVVVPIVIRPTAFDGAPFARLQMLPRDARPVSRWEDPDEAWVDVVMGVQRVVERLEVTRSAGELNSTPMSTVAPREDQEEAVAQPQLLNTISLDSTHEQEETELPEVNSAMVFWWRLSDAFPGLRGVQEFTSPSEASKRLQILLRKPLRYSQGGDPFWWIGRGNNSIERFEKLEDDHVLMWPFEFRIRRLVAIRSFTHAWRDCVYVETDAAPPIGVYSYSQAEIETWLRALEPDDDFAIDEEYAIWQGRPITRAEYDDGSALIDGLPTRVSGAELRIRFLTPSNFILCGKRHVVNQTAADRMVRPVLNRILRGTAGVEDLIDIIGDLPLPRSYDDPGVW